MLESLRHLFLPHEGNNHRARLLQPTGLAVLLGLFLFFDSSVKLLAAVDNQIVSGGVLGYTSTITPEEVIELTNEERVANGKSILVENSLLSQAAQAKASDMFAFNYWAHTNPQTGREPWAFIKEAGYTYRYAGENLARDFGDTPSVMAAWMASPTHRENVLSDRYQEIGIGVVEGELENLETTLVVQMFGAPASGQAIGSANLEGGVSSLESIITQTPAVAGIQKSLPQNTNLISPQVLSKAMGTSVLLLLAVALIIDAMVARRRQTVRVSGKNLAHLTFVAVLMIIVLATNAGGIL